MSNAEAVVAAQEERNAGAVELATFAAPAVFIESALLRALRLALLPRHGADVEADLWFSGLVSARSTRGIAFDTDVAGVLRQRLRARHADPATRPAVEQAWALVSRFHEQMSPALRLEERVAWLACRGEPAGSADAELRRALAALATGERPGLADWAERAWQRLPPEMRTQTAWGLRQAARHVRRERLALVPAGGGASFDLRSVLTGLETVRLGVRRVDEAIEVGHALGDVAILVPDTDPRLVEVIQEDGELRRQTLQLPPGGQATAKVSAAAVRLRTAAGVVYELPAVEAGRTQGIDVSALEGAYVAVRGPSASGVGFLATPELVVAGAATVGSAAPGSWPSADKPVVLTRHGREVEADVELVDGALAVLRPRGPISAKPIEVPPSSATPSRGDPWASAGFTGETIVFLRGRIGGLSTGDAVGNVTLELIPDEPGAARPGLDGAPVVTSAGLAGVVIRLQRSPDVQLEAVAVAAVFDLLQRAEAHGEAPRAKALADVLQSIALAFHVGLRELPLREASLYDLVGKEVGLTSEQFDALKGASEWIVEPIVEEILSSPRSSIAETSAEVVDGIVAATRGRDAPVRLDLFDSTWPEVLERDLRGGGLVLQQDPGSSRTDIVGDADAFAAVVERLGAELLKDLHAYDEWSAVAPAAPASVDSHRLDALLAFMSEVERTLDLPREVDETLDAISRTTTPSWWDTRDRFVAVGLPGVDRELDAPAFLDLYLRHVSRILLALGKRFGGARFENGYAIERPSLALLRREEMLEPLQAVGTSTYGTLLGGPFGGFAELFAWASEELMRLLGGPVAA